MSPLVVGIGNPSRGDDGIGPLVADRVARLRLRDVEVVVHDEPLALIEHLALHDDVVVVDAAWSRSGHQPGTVHVVRVDATPLRSGDPVRGSHGLGVVEAVELARALDRLPQRLTLVGVEARVFDVGATMTRQVQDCVDDAVRAVVAAIFGTTGTRATIDERVEDPHGHGLAGRTAWYRKENIMGRLVSNTSMTVDGLCDVGAWFVAEGDHDTAGVAQLAAAAGFVTGRKCYEGFLGYWPSATGPWAQVLNPMPKYIASRTLSGDLDWNSHVIEGDAVEGVRRLKDDIAGDLFLSGCGELACGLLEGGVVDEVNLWVHPAIGGAGTRPFEGTTLSLELLDVTAFDSGVVRQRYRPQT